MNLNSTGSKDKNTSSSELSGKVALITGGSTGIGFATAELFIEEGAKVAILSRNQKRLDAAGKRMDGADDRNLLTIQCDVTKENEIIDAFDKLIQNYGKLDIVVNNAGITYSAPIEKTTLELWEKLHAFNNTEYFLVSREAYKIFQNQGNGGVFVFVASDNSLKPSKESIAYNVSKAAELQLSRTIAAEGGQYNIRSNCVLPGAVFGISALWTDEYRTARAKVHGFAPDLLEEEYKKANALGVIIYPEEVAEVILFLACDRSAKMTGNALVIDGGASGSYVR